MDDNYTESSDRGIPTPSLSFITSLLRLAFTILLTITTTHLYGQKVVVRGKVLNARTNEAVEFSNVLVTGSTTGTQSDLNGAYALELAPGTVTLRASFVGYAPESKTITIDGSQKVIVLNFRLQPQQKSLSEVTVRGKRERYRNKDNPAVALIEKVIAHKSQNRKESFSFYQYNKYEKIEFDLSNISEKFRNRRSLKKFDFVFNYLDTSQVTGKVNLPIYLKEAVSNVLYSRNPERKKEIVEGEKMTGLGNYVDNNGIKVYLETLYQDVNVYDNNIMLLSNQFLGPTAPLAPQFYKYVIIDSTDIKGVRCVNLGFSPRNKTDLLFQGTMSVALDSSYAIRKIVMGFSKDININFVTDMRLAQEYDFVQNQGLMLTKDELAIEFNLLKKENGMGLFGQRSVSYRDYLLNQPIDLSRFTGLSTDVDKDAQNRPDTFWAEARHQPLSGKEQGIYAMVDSVKKVPVFQKFMNTAMFLLEGYKPIGPFEIGPVSTFYSFNPVEGFRLRVGGRTTASFSDRMAFETYGAYGFRDKRFKYFASATFSLTDHNTYTYPIKHIQVSVQNELKIPGQELQFVQEDNFLLSFKRGPNNRRTYNQVINLDYLNESKNGLTFNLNVKRIEQTPAGALTFEQSSSDGGTILIPNVTSTELTAGLRYAPHQQFYQGKNYRIPIVNKYPIIQVRFTAGVKGPLGGQYNFQRLIAYANKRFYISPIGYTDVSIEGGQTFGRVPFPLLTIHRANQTYSYQPEAYNMMNFLEFVSDHYGAIFADHYFNGFIFNKIPLIKKLKLREVVTIKSLWGGLRSENRPSPENLVTGQSGGLLKLPTDQTGNPVTFALGSRPYVEASVGIANIFKVLRVDLIKRLTYLENPLAPQGYGIRFRMKFDF
ncbi:carboxypeptidase-like regulatory domain-containing protein [Spirosoma sp. HMF4905]|uniref:Carboxypeptidase-like regulatory domain-containing protein n=1 Tax=Spirosoma arboris TaxID=2682092 RepID=A0A7K1SQF7_9BACT|nr:DUF5686 and carboxypeptidase-like regulatory domain-containing protein [Spirosoma arboris]MVM36045.1 carboxypeptidase-like regulatory domain-containing protein [Spirosoma arboris]